MRSVLAVFVFLLAVVPVHVHAANIIPTGPTGGVKTECPAGQTCNQTVSTGKEGDTSVDQQKTCVPDPVKGIICTSCSVVKYTDPVGNTKSCYTPGVPQNCAGPMGVPKCEAQSGTTAGTGTPSGTTGTGSASGSGSTGVEGTSGQVGSGSEILDSSFDEPTADEVANGMGIKEPSPIDQLRSQQETGDFNLGEVKTDTDGSKYAILDGKKVYLNPDGTINFGRAAVEANDPLGVNRLPITGLNTFTGEPTTQQLNDYIQAQRMQFPFLSQSLSENITSGLSNGTFGSLFNGDTPFMDGFFSQFSNNSIFDSLFGNTSPGFSSLYQPQTSAGFLLPSNTYTPFSGGSTAHFGSSFGSGLNPTQQFQGAFGPTPVPPQVLDRPLSPVEQLRARAATFGDSLFTQRGGEFYDATGRPLSFDSNLAHNPLVFTDIASPLQDAVDFDKVYSDTTTNLDTHVIDLGSADPQVNPTLDGALEDARAAATGFGENGAPEGAKTPDLNDVVRVAQEGGTDETSRLVRAALVDRSVEGSNSRAFEQLGITNPLPDGSRAQITDATRAGAQGNILERAVQGVGEVITGVGKAVASLFTGEPTSGAVGGNGISGGSSGGIASQILGTIAGNLVGGLLNGGGQGGAPTTPTVPTVPTTPVTQATPTVLRLSCDPGAVKEGGTSTISWACSNALTSRGVGFNTNNAPSGSVQVELGAETTSYGVVCLSGTVESQERSCSVAVVDPAVVLATVPQEVVSGDRARIGWTGKNVRRCGLFGPDGLIKESSGKVGVGTTAALEASSRFVVLCETVLAGETVQTDTVVTVRGYTGGVRDAQVGTLSSAPVLDTNDSFDSTGDTGSTNTTDNTTGTFTATDENGNEVKLCDPGMGMFRFTQCLLNN